MAAAQPPRFAFAIVLLTALGAVAPRAQEPAAGARPEDVLKRHDLKRSGSFWVLPGETALLKDFRDAQALQSQVRAGVVQQEQLDMGVQAGRGMIQQLRAQSAQIAAQIEGINQQLNALVSPPGGNVFVDQQRNQLVQQNNVLVAQQRQIELQLQNLNEQNPDRGQGQAQEQRVQLNAEVAQAREKYMQAVLDLRKSVDELTAKYAALAKDPEVTGALKGLSAATKSTHRLGPSKVLQDKIKLLGRLEGSVQSDTIELHRDSGVFHVYATLSGKHPTKMVFDTGAGLTTISARLAAKVGVKPRPTDERVRLKIADGTEVDGRLMTIPSVLVGRFTIRNVPCAVMPEEKGEVDPLLGQSFFKYFKVEFSPEAGRLSLKKLETDQAGASDATADESGAGPKAGAGPRRPGRNPRGTPTKGQRPPRGRRPSAPRDASPPDFGGDAEPASGGESPN